MKFRAKKFSPGPVLCNESIIYKQTKKLGQRTSHLPQFPVIEISFTSTHTKN